MTVLYLDRNTLKLEKEGRSLVIRDHQERITTVPLHMLERIVIRGKLQLTSNLLYQLVDEGVQVAVLGRRSEQLALVHGSPGPDGRRRLAQYRLYHDSAWRMDWSVFIVNIKLRQQYRLLNRLRGQRPDLRLPLVQGMDKIDNTLKKLRSRAVRDIEQLMGMEGAAAKIYFGVLTHVFPKSLDFQGRNRRPPKDPVNASLSLGYTLLHSELTLACLARGLDPFIGFYHEPDHGRESLAADLMEPLRPEIDGWIHELFRNRELRGHHFHKKGKACLLGKKGRGIFYRAWEIHARPLRSRIRRHMNTVVRAIKEGASQ